MHLMSWYLGKSEHETLDNPMVMSPTRPKIDTPSEKYLFSRPLSNRRATLRRTLAGVYILPRSSRSHAHHLRQLRNTSKSARDARMCFFFLFRKYVGSVIYVSLFRYRKFGACSAKPTRNTYNLASMNSFSLRTTYTHCFSKTITTTYLCFSSLSQNVIGRSPCLSPFVQRPVYTLYVSRLFRNCISMK
jgi:hypothetical protein